MLKVFKSVENTYSSRRNKQYTIDCILLEYDTYYDIDIEEVLWENKGERDHFDYEGW